MAGGAGAAIGGEKRESERARSHGGGLHHAARGRLRRVHGAEGFPEYNLEGAAEIRLWTRGISQTAAADFWDGAGDRFSAAGLAHRGRGGRGLQRLDRAA